jgi:hypothetical protein
VREAKKKQHGAVDALGHWVAWSLTPADGAKDDGEGHTKHQLEARDTVLTSSGTAAVDASAFDEHH